MLTIDGSLGEGGGQILRSSLALSLCLGKPFRIVNIRAARRRPGLMPQHLTAVAAAAQIGDADVEGASIGSLELTFVPARIQPGEYRFPIGTAGSTTLVLQTVLPALLTANNPSHLVLEGGTHNPLAPPFDFIALAFLPLVNRMGPSVSAHLERAGFYPVGGGIIDVHITPSTQLRPLHLLERGRILEQRARATVANLPDHIAERELDVIKSELGFSRDNVTVCRDDSAKGAGNVVTVVVKCQHITEVFAGFGTRGVRAETVAHRLVKDVRRYLTADVPVGQFLADQILMPMALASSGSYITMAPTSHTTTNIAVLQQFLPVSIKCEGLPKNKWRITLG